MSNPISVCGSTCPKPVLQQPSFTTQFTDFFKKLLDTADWPARWHCGNWSSFHGWLYIFSDVLIGASYFAIPLLLIRLLKKRPDIPFPKIIWLFIAFIVFCGTTHLADAALFWWPAYRLSALIRLLTGIISAFAVYALYKVMPMIFSLRSVKELENEINQRLAAEAALSEAHEALLKSHGQLNNFTHILSHNIRNHSSNISLLTSMIEKETLTGDNPDLIEKLETVSTGLNQTLNDLAEALMIREQKIASEEVSFKMVTDKTIGILQTEIEENKAQIITDFKVENVIFPKLYLESIMLNLVSNSIKYRKADTSPVIKLTTTTNATGNVVLECGDNGLGIDLVRHSDRVFGLYKTFHAHKNAHGIGLFLVKNQVEAQGGNISVKSNPGKGAKFTITFA